MTRRRGRQLSAVGALPTRRRIFLGTVEDVADEWDALSPRQRRAFAVGKEFNEAQRERRDLQRRLRALEEREITAWYGAGNYGQVPMSPERRRLAAAYKSATKREESLVAEFMRQYRRTPPGWGRTRDLDLRDEEPVLDGLPTKGRIPLATAKRALSRLPKKTKACGFTASELREGMEIEREHRDVTQGAVGTTAKIAAAHLCERLDYYKRIKKYVER